MKILHLSTQDNGGAGRAAVRLHQALLQKNINSYMFVQNKTSDLLSIHQVPQTQTQKLFTPFRIASDQLPTLFYKSRQRDIFSSTFFPSNKILLQKIKELNPDIIHLHWINSGFINLLDLVKIKLPILWSLHDTNPYTGGCHVYSNGCQKYKSHCHACPLLRSNSKHDISYFNFKRKQKVYKNLNLVVNGLSRWITSEAKSSALLRDKPIINLPNTIDTSIFRPIDKSITRNLLKINREKKILGFGAISGTQIERKGYSQLKETLESLPDKHLYQLVVFGSSHGEEIGGIETIFLGHLYDETTLTLLYNSLDIFITPSLAENLSNTIMESLSCGTPVVAFDIGGNSDLITHKENGYLATNTQELGIGIQWCIKNQAYLSINARESVLGKFDYNTISKRYIAEYKAIIEHII